MKICDFECIEASTHFWIHISSMYVSLVVDKIIKNCEYFSENKIMWSANISFHNKFPLYGNERI